jgi:hypothetical protein
MSPQQPEPFWVPPNLLPSGSLPKRQKDMNEKADTYPHLLLRFGLRAANTALLFRQKGSNVRGGRGD